MICSNARNVDPRNSGQHEPFTASDGIVGGPSAGSFQRIRVRVFIFVFYRCRFTGFWVRGAACLRLKAVLHEQGAGIRLSDVVDIVDSDLNECEA